MMEIKKLSGAAQERRQQDDIAAKLARLEANQDYIAMMTDVELDEGEEEEATNE